MNGTSTLAPTGQDVDKIRAFLALQHERETIDEVGWIGRALVAAGVPRDVLWAVREPIFKAAQMIVRDVPSGHRAEVRAIALREILAGAQALRLARPQVRVQRLRAHAVTAAPRPVRVRVRTRECRSSHGARRTSSTSSGDSSGEPGPGDEPPGDDAAALPCGGVA